MCGFFGYISPGSPVDATACLRSLQTLAHRGPDGFGVALGQTGRNCARFYLNPAQGALQGAQLEESDFFLGHRRLSIIDLDRKAFQPMTNEDGTLWIVFNGEIYNHAQLRRELEGCGHAFRTAHSDTEVLVHGYEQWGAELPKKLRGMFAFAILDLPRKELFLARDRFGEKPLYYRVSQGGVLFASELKALVRFPLFEKKVCKEAIVNYLACGVVPAPLSIYQGVYKLQPSQSMTLSLQPGFASSASCYWQLRYTPSAARSAGEWRELFNAALQSAVESRMVSDVPVGAFLSGGLDSSIVVREMCRLSSKPVHTFSIGFADKRYDESPFAQQVADRYRTEHHNQTVSSEDLLGNIPVLQHHFDEPFADSSAVPTYLVSKLAQQHVKVVLSGDGGDELLAGYKHYRYHAAIARYLDRCPELLVRSLVEPLASLWPESARGKGLVKLLAAGARRRYARHWCDQYLVGLLARDFGASPDYIFDTLWPAEESELIDQMCLVDTRFFVPEDAMVKVDRASMAVSLEARTPLFDHELFELVAQMPLETRYDGRAGKLPFRDLLTQDLGAEFVQRPKRGFAIPIGRWFRKELRDELHDTLLGGSNLVARIFNPADLRALIRWHGDGSRDLSPQLWRLYMLEKWHSLYGGVL